MALENATECEQAATLLNDCALAIDQMITKGLIPLIVGTAAKITNELKKST